jgi:pyruvate,water dikinase
VTSYLVDLTGLDRTQVALAGGKGAHLGELTRIEGVAVPPGFCVTSGAFRAVVTPAIDGLTTDLRRAVEAVPIPDDLAAAVAARVEEGVAYAVRSSATAEDLPSASFAGQHDTFLDIVGAEAVLEHVRRCWASLFTERAVAYRRRNGIDHRVVDMAVVVQRMVHARASGVLFTADPVTSHRGVTTVEATPGLGEALVSGRVNAEAHTVRDGAVVSTVERPLLTADEVLRLDGLGRRIEAHFGHPQDIEWCLDDDGRVWIVQSRPITTVFPVPANDDGGNHVYVSVGHQQMMTDPLKPLGLSFWQLTTPRPMAEAGGRLFVDVTRVLATPTGRAGLIGALGRSDPLIGDALRTIADRPGFLPSVPDEPWAPPGGGAQEPIATDPAIVTDLIARSEAAIAAVEREIAGLSGAALLDFIRADLQDLRRVMFDPRSMRVVMAGMEATWWLNDHLHEWLGERNAADRLTQSVPHNVTSEMGLALLDVADVVRRHPDVVAFLENADSLDDLPSVDGGPETRDAIRSFLDRYGMRCVGEIDITRPRWSERPTALVPLILSNVRGFEPGARARLFAQGLRDAREAERDLLARLRSQPDGERKARETKEMIDRVRAFIGYREYPKYHMVSLYSVYKRALLREHGEDIFYLTFDELYDVVRTGRVDGRLVRERREAHASYAALTPPRVFTSDGEVVTGSYRREGLPPGTLVGLAVSAGTVEGRARVIADLADADLEPGDILVTAFTDPSWTPAFVSIAGLVTEVGGLMTHGAVIAREYGLPAVVGVERATTLIRDGQRIRVDGTDGSVEVLPAPA